MASAAELLDELTSLPPGRQAERIRSQPDPDALLVALGDEAERLAVVEVQRALRASELVMLLADELGRARGRVRARRARAQALAYSGQMEAALATCGEAVTIGEQCGERIEAARARVASMHALGELGRYDEAIAAGEAAYQTFVEFSEPDLQARADINLGVIHQNRDAPRQALFHFRRASEALPAEAGQLPFFVANNSGEALLLLNDFAGAEQAFRVATEQAERLEAPFARALAEGNLADLHARCGRLQQALRHFEMARRAFEQDTASSHQARLLAEQAEVLAALGLLEESRRTFHAAIAQLETHGQVAELARAALALADVEARLGHEVAAEQAVRDAGAHFRSIGQVRAAALVELRRAELLAHSDPTAATANVEQLRDRLGGRPLDRAALAAVATQIALADDRPVDARVEAARGLADLADLPFAPLATELLRRKALAEFRLGELPAAANTIGRAIEQFERTRGLLAGERFRAALAAHRADVFADAMQIFLAADGSDRLARVFDVLERSRSRNLLDRAHASESDEADVGTDDAAGLRSEARGLRAEVSGLYSRLADLHFSPAESSKTQALRQTLHDREAALHAVEQRIESTADLREFSAAPLALDDARRHLTSDEVVVSYLPVGDDVRAMVLRGDEAHLVDLGLEHAELQRRLQRFRFQIDRAQRGHGPAALRARIATDLQRELDWLGLRLLGAVHPLIAGAARLGFVPFGGLYAVPFACLRLREQYLVRDHDVFLTPGVSILARLRQIPCDGNWRDAALILGRADAHAPQIEEEARRVIDLVPGARGLVGEDATTSAFEQAAGDAGLIHLACHGHFDETLTTQAGLRLADRWLGFRELYRHRLRARLVMLSGCETGRGTVGGDEQILGMLGGFLRCGVRAVICTLWPVSDAAATELATDFYRELIDGPAEPLAALAAAQRTQCDAGAGPLEWGGHTLVGLP